jgi:large subunit ribosomal protein L9
MQVILTQDLVKVGKEGDIVKVADGYGRNYLIPRGLAMVASPGAIKTVQARQSKEAERSAQILANATAAKEALDGKTVTIKVKAGKEGRLYGSITASDIASAVQSSYNVTVDKRRIALHDSIKKAGLYTVPVRLHTDVAFDLSVEVVASTE